MRMATTTDEQPNGKASFRELVGAEADTVLRWANEYAANRVEGERIMARWLAAHPVAAEDNDARAAEAAMGGVQPAPGDPEPADAPAEPDPYADAMTGPPAPTTAEDAP
jgi:hypothetical protein